MVLVLCEYCGNVVSGKEIDLAHKDEACSQKADELTMAAGKLTATAGDSACAAHCDAVTAEDLAHEMDNQRKQRRKKKTAL